MPRVSAAFFAVGVLCVLSGMLWGMHMGAAHDMVTAPAHAHLNLLGWVTMALYGTFYTLEGETILPKLAWLNFLVSTIGVVVMIPSLFLFLSHGNDPKYVPYMSAGEGLTVLGMLIFAISVLRELFRRRA
jgi:cbb3-type cytochrome oxidase subunit 1